MNRWATVITDASFCHRTKKAGWAAWVRLDGQPKPITRYDTFKAAIESSQDAEIKAALNGVRLARRAGATRVLLQSDCMAVIDLINGVTKKPSSLEHWRSLLEHADLTGYPVEARHVKGHTDDTDARSWANRWCDQHAKRARRRRVVRPNPSYKRRAAR